MLRAHRGVVQRRGSRERMITGYSAKGKGKRGRKGRENADHVMEAKWWVFQGWAVE